MSIGLEQNIFILKDKIIKINNNYKKLLENYNELEKKNIILKRKYDEEQEKNYRLLEELKEVKLISSISGNSEHNRLMKNHINRLIKEIDVCIAHIKNIGL